MRNTNIRTLIAVTIAFAFWGCEEEGERVALTPPTDAPPATASPSGLPSGPPAGTPAETPGASASKTRYGSVVEVLAAGEYTIARMDACGQEAWTAGPPTEMAIGQTVEMEESLIMEKFHSKTLDRTFDIIMFVQSYIPSDKKIICPPKPTDDPGPGKPGHGGGANIEGAAPGQRFVGKVAETMDSGGYTYVKLVACGKEQWFAGTPLPVKVGQTLIAIDGLEMTNFTSKTLGRVFSSIQFVRTFTHVEGEPKCE